MGRLARLPLMLFALLACAGGVTAQHVLRGSFADAQSKEALPIVAVIYDEAGHGFTSDLEGGFRAVTAKPIVKLRTSYIGYKDTTFVITAQQRADSAVYYLTPRKLDIVEVYVTAGDPAALALVRRALGQRRRHDPASLPGYRFTSYSKLVGSFYQRREADSAQPDSVGAGVALLPREEDSTGVRHYIFVNETVARRHYERRGSAIDSVLSTRTSGLQRMMLPIVSNTLASLSFYEENLEILGEKYVNPFGSQGPARYWYAMRDTLVTSLGDSIFSVYFWPRSNSVRDDLSGLLHINSREFALSGVVVWSRPKVEGKRGELVYASAGTADLISQFRIAQRYEQHGGRAWFPKELRSEITLQGIDLQSESHISGIELLSGEQLGGRRPLAGIVLPGANDSASERTLDRYRTAPLRAVERQTYRTIDSVSGVFKLEDKVDFVRLLMQGYVGWGPVRFDLLRLFDYNACEGYRLGLGVESSDRVSSIFRIGGYYAYGLRDKRHKYGGHVRLRVLPTRDGWLEAHYSHDAHAPGQMPIQAVRPRAFRDLYVRQMDYRDCYGLGLMVRVGASVQMALGAQYQRYSNRTGYGNALPASEQRRMASQEGYALTMPYVSLHWDPYALLIGGQEGLTVIRTKPAPLSLYAQQGLGVGGTRALFTRVELAGHWQVGHALWGDCDIEGSVGAIWGQYPLSQGFISEGFDLRWYGLGFPRMLTTVSQGFFYHDFQAVLAWQYTLPETWGIRIADSWRPTPCLQATALWGGQWHRYALPSGGDLRRANRGFFEVGVGFNHALPGSLWGISNSLSARYRVGAYSSGLWRENLSIVLTLWGSLAW